ncbi:MAG: ABC transporter permease [Bacteroidota bacterium]
MSKIGLIIQREYVTRVRKKSFLILTIVTPLALIGLMFGIFYFALNDVDEKVIEVVDESGYFENKFEDSESIKFSYEKLSLEESKQRLVEESHFGTLYIPEIDIDSPDGIIFLSSSNPSPTLMRRLDGVLNDEIENIKLERSGISQSKLDSLRSDISIKTLSVTEEGEEKESSAAASFGIGYVSSFLIYMFIFLYGAQVMRGVIEEKTNKVVEVIVSSVKPFDLMMGKIIGVSLVGLTQFIIWIVLIFVAGSAVMGTLGLEEAGQMAEASSTVQAQGGAESPKAVEVLNQITSLNMVKIVSLFLFYYLGGYLMYGALFAAVGAAADSDTDTQQFMFPISMPLIIGIIALGFVLQEPNGNMAFWLSVIPFTSPIVMMARIPFEVVGTGELILSMVMLVGGFFLTTWIAGRIYRIGILMHGAKVNYKTLAKWFTMKT